jgi:Ca-activated chloride channel family protein
VNLRSLWLALGPALLLPCSLCVLAQPQGPVFRVNTNLQSIAVQVTDKLGKYVGGLTASDFTLLESGRPQKIAFFESQSQPISLAIVLDVGRSMDWGGKLERALVLLAPLLRGNLREDEIFFMPFTDEAGPFRQLTADERLQRPTIPLLGHRGSAVYDALASALCYARTASNARQAIIVITDGMDQHSRLRLEQLIELVRSSNPQIFMVGLYDQPEYEIWRQSHQTVTIIGLREVDNPVIVFNRLAKESGAEAFFPSSEKDLRIALDRISALLKAQYTLAYYPERADKARKIQVKVDRRGVKISARGSVGSEIPTQAIHVAATGCEVSAREHPYPWESRVTSTSGSPVVYHEDFSDERSGWPNRLFDENTHSSARYIKGGYELDRHCPRCDFSIQSSPPEIATGADTVITAYGPWWDSFRASASMEAYRDDAGAGVGVVFGVQEEGYYAFLLTAPAGEPKQNTFELVKGSWDGKRNAIIPRTPFGFSSANARKVYKLGVARNGRLITLWVDDTQVGSIEDPSLEYGLVGFGVFGSGRAVVHDLLVETMQFRNGN